MRAFSNFVFWIITRKLLAVDEWRKRVKYKEIEIKNREINLKKERGRNRERNEREGMCFGFRIWGKKKNTQQINK